MVQFFFFFSKQRNTHFFYMLIYKRSLFSLYIYIYIYYIIYKSVNFFLRFSRAGTVHTPGTEACHTCIAFCILQLVGWQAWCHPGSAAVGEFTNTHTHPPHFSPHSFFCFRIYTQTTTHHPYTLAPAYPAGGVTLSRWHQSRGGVKGLAQQASDGIKKAVQQGSAAHAEMGGGNGCCLGQRSKVKCGGCTGFKWKMWGRAQGCRQIHEWEVGRVWGEKGWQGKEGQCYFHDDYICSQFFFSLFFILCDFFCCFLLYMLLFTNGIMT